MFRHCPEQSGQHEAFSFMKEGNTMATFAHFSQAVVLIWLAALAIVAVIGPLKKS
jgi:hypothetical protein